MGKNKYSFCDLFAGIGGVRLGFEGTGRFQCVFGSEINDKACATYEANFGENPKGDITKLDAAGLPDFDVLCAGFPCQSFSICGRREGFEDTRGTLFFDVCRILEKKRPRAVFFENVEGLTTHDKGRTFRVISQHLEDLGYHICCKVLNAADHGVPQKRERIYIVGFDVDFGYGEDAYPMKDFFPPKIPLKSCVRDVLEKGVPVDLWLSEEYMRGLEKHKGHQEDEQRGFGYEILKPRGPSNTIVCGGMGRERNLVVDHDVPPDYDAKLRNPLHARMLTPREFARLQGFPDGFKIVGNRVDAYRQFGNSVAVPVVRAIAERIAEHLDRRDGIHGS